MPVPKISRHARARIVERLAHNTTGFNAYFNAAIADAGIELPAGWKLPIDFTSDRSKNFFEADVDAFELDSTSVSTYPVITLFSCGAVNRNQEKFRMFSGTVQFGINVFCSWKTARVTHDFETPMDCVEEALYQVFNGTAVQTWATDDTLCYNGDLSLPRTALKPGANNWTQAIVGKLTVEVSALG